MREEKSVMEGPLLLRRGFVFVSKKYCRLVSNQFFVFPNEEDTAAETIAMIDSDCDVQIESKDRFTLTSSDGLSLTFQASSSSEMLRWVLEFRACAFTNSRMSMSMFTVVSVLGRGRFSKVLLCRRKDTGELVAIKTCEKATLIERKKVDMVLSEKNILVKIQHPFIVGIKFAFQTRSKFYIGLEYMPGGDLFHLLSRHLVLPIDDVKLYVAELALALQALHESNIVYRDLKPENVMIDKDGHLKIADFGMSRELREDDDDLSFCGTCEYLAPEIVKREHYSFGVDWWTLGVMTYELLFGTSPFAKPGANPKVVLRRILTYQPEFKSTAPPDVVEFITGLLSKNPGDRWGFDEIQSSSWYSGWNWDDVINKRIHPSHVPRIASDDDLAHFDSQFTSEKPSDCDFFEGADQRKLPRIPGFSFPGFMPTPPAVSLATTEE